MAIAVDIDRRDAPGMSDQHRLASDTDHVPAPHHRLQEPRRPDALGVTAVKGDRLGSPPAVPIPFGASDAFATPAGSDDGVAAVDGQAGFVEVGRGDPGRPNLLGGQLRCVDRFTVAGYLADAPGLINVVGDGFQAIAQPFRGQGGGVVGVTLAVDDEPDRRIDGGHRVGDGDQPVGVGLHRVVAELLPQLLFERPSLVADLPDLHRPGFGSTVGDTGVDVAAGVIVRRFRRYAIDVSDHRRGVPLGVVHRADFHQRVSKVDDQDRLPPFGFGEVQVFVQTEAVGDLAALVSDAVGSGRRVPVRGVVDQVGPIEVVDVGAAGVADDRRVDSADDVHHVRVQFAASVGDEFRSGLPAPTGPFEELAEQPVVDRMQHLVGDPVAGRFGGGERGY